MEINSAQPAREVVLDTVDVKIKGHQYISKKLFEVVMHILVDQDVEELKCINEIEFSTEEPVGKFGTFKIETLNITVNLQKNFDFAVELVKDEHTSTLSLRSHLWYNLLTTVIHEILHGMAYKIDPEKMVNSEREIVEEEIRKEAAAYLRELIRDYEVEPASMDDEPFFGSLYMEFYVKNIKENAEQWAINQAIVHDEEVIWKDGDCICDTFRQWYRISYNLEKDKSWDREVKPPETVEVVIEEAKALIAEATVDAQLPVIVVGDTPDVVELTAKTKANVETVVEPVALPEGIDSEMMALMDVEEVAEVNMEEAFTPAAAQTPLVENVVIAQTAAATPPLTTADPSLPEKHLACRTCSATLSERAKFCSVCGTSTETTPMPDLTGPAPQAVAVQPVYTQTPQFSQGAKRPMRHDLPNYNHTAEQIRACVGEVFNRCYQHIFSKCGFMPSQNPSYAPEIRNAVMEPISIVGIPFIEQILIGMDSLDPLNGTFTWCVPPVNGMVRGKITKNLGLPSYTLYFNFNGHEAKRLLMPQNQWKVGGNETYSAPAQRSQQGAAIIWMMDGDDNAPGQKWRAKIENGVLEWLI